MAPSFEKLDPVNQKQFEQLEEALLKRLPESVHMLVLLRLANQRRFPAAIDTKFYQYQDDEKEECKDPFIVCIQRPNFHAPKGVIVYTPQTLSDDMTQAFDNLVDWQEPQQFQSIQQPFWESIWKLIRRHGKLIPEKSLGFPWIVYAITDLEKARNLEVPEIPKMEVRELKDEDISQVDEKRAKPLSKEQAKNCIGSLLSCGSFEHGKKLASSVLLSPLGSYDVLYSPDEFRGRGLNQLVMRWISREGARKIGIMPVAEVESFNEARKAILRKTGYEEKYHTRWFIYEPVSKNESKE